MASKNEEKTLKELQQEGSKNHRAAGKCRRNGILKNGIAGNIVDTTVAGSCRIRHDNKPLDNWIKYFNFKARN